MTRSIIRRVDWTCSVEPSSPYPVHAFECTTCGEIGQADDLFERARDFVFEHVGRNPSHTGFRETVTRHWRMHGEGVDQAPALVDEPRQVHQVQTAVASCPECDGRGARVLPGASAETECDACEGTGRDAVPLGPECLSCHDVGCADCGRVSLPSTPTREYGAPYVPIYGTAPRDYVVPVQPSHLGPVDSGATEPTERY